MSAECLLIAQQNSLLKDVPRAHVSWSCLNGSSRQLKRAKAVRVACLLENSANERANQGGCLNGVALDRTSLASFSWPGVCNVLLQARAAASTLLDP
jgi:hypothetical protein